MKYRLTPAADRDLLQVFLHSLRTFGRAQAERYYNSLRAELVYITEYPQAARERKLRRVKARFHPFGAHVIIYRIDASEIVVLRILHGRQDPPRHLK